MQIMKSENCYEWGNIYTLDLYGGSVSCQKTCIASITLNKISIRTILLPMKSNQYQIQNHLKQWLLYIIILIMS